MRGNKKKKKFCCTRCTRFNIIINMIGWLAKTNPIARCVSTFNNMIGSMKKNCRAARAERTLRKLIT